MPEVFREGGYRFFFYANEGNPREPVHIHFEKGDDEAKFWLRPDVSLSYNDGFDAASLRKLIDLIYWRRELIEMKSHDFFGDS